MRVRCADRGMRVSRRAEAAAAANAGFGGPSRGGGGFAERPGRDRYAFSGGGYQDPMPRGGGGYGGGEEVRSCSSNAQLLVCPLMHARARRNSAMAPASARATPATGAARVRVPVRRACGARASRILLRRAATRRRAAAPAAGAMLGATTGATTAAAGRR